MCACVSGAKKNFHVHIQYFIITGANLVCKVVYMEGIKYMSLIEIGPIVFKLQ